MSSTAQQRNGMRGVYLVAAELVRQGLIASPTSRSAYGADILVTNDCKKSFSVQVKSITNNSFYQLPRDAKKSAPAHIYVFVHIKKSNAKKTGANKIQRQSKKQTPDEEIISYYPVKSKIVAEEAYRVRPSRDGTRYRDGYTIDVDQIKRFENKWKIFGISEDTSSFQRIQGR